MHNSQCIIKNREQRTKNKIQSSEFKIQRDSFDGVFDRLNHRLGMTPTIQQYLTP